MHQLNLGALEKETQAKAAGNGFPYINLVGLPISPETIAVIDENQSKQLQVICFYNGDNTIKLGAVDPNNSAVAELLRQLEEQYHNQGQLYMISRNSFEQAYKLYAVLPKITKVVAGLELTEEDLNRFAAGINNFKDIQEGIKKTSMTDLVTFIVAGAIKNNASDIHVEAEEKEVKVRYRIDGILHDVAILDKKLWKRIISRFKLLSHLKINITNKPQDGRFTIFIKNQKVEVRVSTLPTSYGESLVTRLLMPASLNLPFEELGMRGKAYLDLLTEIEKPNGMIITTGPTGSGKTTTLYSILKRLNKPETKIITLEDPIEYHLDGIAQSQIEPEKKYTFANGLRNILRQDPDIIMIGEIRDLETAEIALNAALTGHLVLSTLHTNDAAGAIPRFLAMGAKPFLLSPALNAVIGQRLVRRICLECKQVDKIDPKNLEKAKAILGKINTTVNKVKVPDLNKLKFYKGGGCEECQGIGFKGRIGIFEIMPMNKELESSILTGNVSEYIIRDINQKNGMLTMVQDGLLKAIDGVTTVDEVFRVAYDISTKGSR